MDDDARREAARRLRLDGWSCRQIAEALGVTQRQAERLVEGLPVPEWTRRPRAKDELKARARELRTQGLSYKEIAAELRVSLSSCSLWLRDMPRPETLYSPERIAAARRGRWEAELAERQLERTAQTFAAGREIGRLSDRELLIAGAVLYWAEGAKSKPWRRSELVAFINSDPDLVLLFLAWLRLLDVDEERLALSVQIHETADVPAAVAYWSNITGVPADRFMKTVLKRHNPKTVRKNVGDDYRGCLVIRVRRSAELYRRIHGLVLGIVAGALAEDHRGTVDGA